MGSGVHSDNYLIMVSPQLSSAGVRELRKADVGPNERRGGSTGLSSKGHDGGCELVWTFIRCAATSG
jgi:hypothetical protein